MSEQASSRSGRLIRVTFPDGEPAQHLHVVAIDDDRLALDFIRAALGVARPDALGRGNHHGAPRARAPAEMADEHA